MNDIDNLNRLLPGKQWYTGIGRALKTFDAYLTNENLSLFRQKEFTEGVAKERQSAQQRLQKAFSHVFFVSLAVIFFERITSTDLSIFGIKAQHLVGMQPLILMFGAFGCFNLITKCIDVLLLNMCLSKIYNKDGFYHSGFFNININSEGLWTEAITPRYFGPKSGLVSKILSGLVAVLLMTTVISMIIFPMTIIGYYSYLSIITPSDNIFLNIFACVALLAIVMSALLLIISVLVPFRYADNILKEGLGQANAIDEEKLDLVLRLKEASSRTQ